MAMHRNAEIMDVRQSIETWLTDVVVKLNLCPFARPVLNSNTLRIVISEARVPQPLKQDIRTELERLVQHPDTKIATTLIATPWILDNFFEFNAFCEVAEQIITDMALDGVVQLAHFHPDYQFQDAGADALSNYTNRSPVPLFHLLREDHVTQAVEQHPDTLTIPERNIQTLEALDPAARQRLKTLCQRHPPKP